MTHINSARIFCARFLVLIVWGVLAYCLFPSVGHASESLKAASKQSPEQTTEQISEQTIADLSLQLFVIQGPDKAPVAEELAALDDKSLIPTLVLAMRWTGSNIYVARALSELAGEEIKTWHEA